jgi:riboflavin biosynthesis pyrimidine reductase
VVTHRPAETIVERGGTSYVSSPKGSTMPWSAPREAAGIDDVQVNGGADIARQYLKVGAIEELRLHLVPVIRAAAPPVRRRLTSERSARPIAADTRPLATHFTYAVERAGTKDS